MKKLLALICAVLILGTFSASLAHAEDTLPESVRVITVSTRIYNSASLDDIKMDGEQEVRAVHGDVFSVLSLTVAENSFYEISYNGASAYILKAHVLDTSVKSSNVKLDTNASLRLETMVYEYNGTSFSETGITLESGTRIKLLDGLNQDADYTRISFELNEETLTYYVPTSNITADGMSAAGITAITLIIACTSLLLILFGFKGRKKKKKEK